MLYVEVIAEEEIANAFMLATLEDLDESLESGRMRSKWSYQWMIGARTSKFQQRSSLS
jgi:hypothetical protein